MGRIILFESNKDIIFEKTTTKNRVKVTVKNKDGSFIHRVYRYNNTKGIEFDSPYISWENLNCCNGWIYDEDYLKKAVQKNKKICAGISFKKNQEMDNYIKSLDRDKYDYADATTYNGKYKFPQINLVRKGCLNDYFNLEEVIDFYELLGLNWDYVNADIFNELFYSDLFDLINGSKDYKYSSINKTISETIIAGLLLGYPLESTASIIFNN